MKVAGIGNTLERTEHDTYKSDREMSICEMRSVVEQARREAERAREDTRFAVQNDLRRLAGLAPIFGTPPATLDTLPVGWYCHALQRATIPAHRQRDRMARPSAGGRADATGGPPARPPPPPGH